jgi:hypothetical protein
MSIEYTFTMTRVEICDNCKYTVTERSAVECIQHARDLINVESKRAVREVWTSTKCDICEEIKHES